MTRRILWTLLISASFQPAQASLYWCHQEGLFFTHPRPEVHHNMEYDALARKYIRMMVELMKTHKCSASYALKMIKVHAERELLAYPNPTIQQFVDDMFEITDPNQILDIMGARSWDSSL